MAVGRRVLAMIPARRLAVVGAGLVVTGVVWGLPVHLAWLDSNFTHQFELQAVGPSGTIYDIHAGFMSPYDIVFTQDRLFFLTDDRVIVDTYGAVLDESVRRDLVRSRSLTGVEVIAERKGEVMTDEARSSSFDHFIQRFFANLNDRGGKDLVLSPPALPQHIWTHEGARPYRYEEPVVAIRVVEIRTLHHDGRVIDSESEVIHVVEIPDSAPSIGEGPA